MCHNIEFIVIGFEGFKICNKCVICYVDHMNDTADSNYPLAKTADSLVIGYTNYYTNILQEICIIFVKTNHVFFALSILGFFTKIADNLKNLIF